MYCNSCGSQIPDGTNVCPKCGFSQQSGNQNNGGDPNAYMTQNLSNVNSPQNQYGGPNQYGVQNQYVNPNQYGVQNQYPNQNQYGGQNQYANPNQYGGQNPYGNPNQYGGQNPYGNPNQYGGQNPYGNPNQYGAPNPYGYPNQNPYGNPYGYQNEGIGMTWNTVLQVFLIIGAVLNTINGIMFFTGAHYQSNASVVKTLYRYYKGLQACDITMGVFCIVFVALEIIACVMLHQRKKGGPTIVIVLYSIVLVINIAYPIVVSLITKIKFEQLISVSVIVSVIVSIVMIIVNAIYYSRRKHIFVR